MYQLILEQQEQTGTVTYLVCAVYALAILDGSFKQIGKLVPGTEEVGPHEVHHAPVFLQVVLQRVTGEHHSAPAYRTVEQSNK